MIIAFGKEEEMLSLFTHYMIICLKNPEYNKKIWWIKLSNNIAGHKSI